MKVYLGSDHAGFSLKEAIKTFLTENGYDVEDCGAPTLDPEDDYTQYIPPVAQKVSQDSASKGIIFGGSGQAEAMLANKFPQIRAAVFYGPVLPKEKIDVEGTVSIDPLAMIWLTRQHNDANILSLGARFLTEGQAKEAVEKWLTTDFSHAKRHERRIEQMKEIAEKV